MINPRIQTVKDIVIQNFNTAEVFKNYSLDFCCGGGKTLEESCLAKGIDLVKILTDLEKSCEKIQTVDFNALTAEEMCSYIIDKHHKYVRNNIQLIDSLLSKTIKVHGKVSVELLRIKHHFDELNRELLEHMEKEENILFPFIILLEKNVNASGRLPYLPFPSIKYPIRQMESEHQFAGEQMKHIISLTGNFCPPQYACATFKVLYQKLDQFCDDLQLHIHRENHILFPKISDMECNYA